MIVSLCMIAYNEAEALDGVLRDFQLQDYPHELIEIVLVDSMSTDATGAKMERFKNTDYGFRNVAKRETFWNGLSRTYAGKGSYRRGL